MPVHCPATSFIFTCISCLYDDGHGGTYSAVHPDFVTNSDVETKYPSDTITHYIRSRMRTEVVVTTYDTMPKDLGAIPGQTLSTQQNLRKRVSAMGYYASLNANTGAGWYNPTKNEAAQHVTYYSYDVEGNVQTITYDYLPLAGVGQQYHRVDYDYDVLSGKVNGVSYNRGHPDQFYHRYSYDADNRITMAETSPDGVIWSRDAAYEYYEHGPLSRAKLGDGLIQSVEYAYTIQGWLKAINGDVLRPDKDMGGNGVAGDLAYGRDVLAHALDYFKGDYQPVAQSASVQQLSPAVKSLWNGNIVRQTTAIASLGNMVRSYRYDQLQRLEQATNDSVDETNMVIIPKTNLFKSTYQYDPDGNMLGLQRWDGLNNQIDNFTYHYDTAAHNNRLLSVSDAVTTSPAAYTDLKSGQPTNNYAYDPTGNLVKDRQGHLQQIAWNMRGKVTSINDSVQNQNIQFDYDGGGNRIWKEVIKGAGTGNEARSGEYYVRDGSGNILATYKTSRIYNLTNSILALDQAMDAGSDYDFKYFIGQDIAALGGFEDGLVDTAITKVPSWADAQTAKNVSFYTIRDGSINSALLSSTDSWIDSLRMYEDGSLGNAYPGTYANALNDAAAVSDMTETDWVQQALQAGPAELGEVMRVLDSATNGADFNEWNNYGIPPGSYTPGNPSANGTAFAAYMAPNSEMMVAQDIMNLMSSDTATARGFWQGLVGSTTVWSSSTLRTTPSAWESDLTTLMTTYGNRTALGDFYDGIWHSSKDWLLGNTSLSQRLEIVYSDDVHSMVNSFVYTVPPQTLASLIAHMPGMTLSGYEYQIAHSVGTGVSAFVDSTTAGEVADTMSLAEHDVYGSSRLGVQTYDWGAVKNIWKYGTATATDSSMSARSAWYSFAYGDLIDKSKTEPWGNGDTGTFTVTRLLGKRYYEVTDHLGNVLVTLLDRKTGHINSAIPTLYDYYSADIASAQDMYPFGMEMPGRTRSYLEPERGYNGQERDNEVYSKGSLNTAKFWEYDTRTGRRWNLDPKPQISISDYTVMENNPILNRDILGDTYEGATKADAKYKQNQLQTRFPTMARLFKLNKDGKTFNKIRLSDLKNSFAGMSEDEAGIARGYVALINDRTPHYFAYLKPSDIVLQNGKWSKNLQNIVKEGIDYNYVEKSQGGGLTIRHLDKNWNVDGTLSITNLDSKAGQALTGIPMPQSTIAIDDHESVGHALYHSYYSSLMPNGSSLVYAPNQDLITIQVENMSIRAMGFNNYRTQHVENGPIFGKKEATQPAGMLGLRNLLLYLNR